jgi:RNA polymerase sigma-70 factor (ECF subfamily)
MHREGALKWPSLAVPFEFYRRHCESVFGETAPCEAVSVNGADLYLCCACTLGDPIAMRLVEREASGVVQEAIARVHREPEFVRETLQEFWKKLLVGPNAKLADYQGRGPLRAWLRVAAARLAIDRQRVERSLSRRASDLGESLLEQEFGPESALTRAKFHEPFRDALRRAVLALPNKDRNVLRMHVLGRCSIDQIARAYQVHRATAARWLQQTREQLLDSVRADLKIHGCTLSNSEFRSVARIVGTGLDVEVLANSSESTR